MKFTMENYKDIQGFEGYYQVSNLGNVKRLNSITSHSRRRREGVLKQYKRKNGYSSVDLCVSGIKKTFLVHRLVAFTFLNNSKEEVNHINGIKSDNRLENLEWNTRSENQLHSIRIGLRTSKGIKNSQSKLNESQVMEIRQMVALNVMKKGDVAKKFNISAPTISDIISKRSWSHI
jgi:hypothetical protein